MTDTEWLQYWLIVSKGNKANAREMMETAEIMCTRVGATREEFIADREAGLIAGDLTGDPAQPKRVQ